MSTLSVSFVTKLEAADYVRLLQSTSLTRKQLRELARQHDVPRGQNTRDTVGNLASAIGRTPVRVMLEVEL